MKRLLLLLGLLGTPLAAQQQRFRVGPIDTRTVLPFAPSPAFAGWWGEVVALGRVTPAIAFERVEWWTTAQQLRCPGFGCRVHGVFLGPKDVVLTVSDSDTECWVKHEMAHAILGRGDEAHDHPVFAAIRRSHACDGSRV